MEFDYARFAEEWSELYRPMLHVRGAESRNRRFYLCDSYLTMTGFMQGMDAECSPCVVLESQQEGSVDGGMDHPRYSFYFMSRAAESHEGYAALRAKREAKGVMLDFVAFLRAFVESDEREGELRGLPLPEVGYLRDLREAVLNGEPVMRHVDVSSFSYESLNELYDGWYGVQVTLGAVRPIPLCVDAAKYA